MSSLNKIALGLILIASLMLMIGSSRQESATMDELAHIPAGYSYVKYLDYRLNPEHPPLVKMMAGLPLLALDLQFPTDSQAWQTAVNGQWDAGRLFLYESGNNADQIIQVSRIGPMVLMLLLVLIVYIWSAEVMGSWWALLPALATALSPNFLAHGHYVTTDIGATLGIVLSLFFFTRYLATPTKKNLIWAGIFFGVAQLMKFSAILLVFHFLIVSLAVALSRISKSGGHPLRQTTRMTARYLGRAIVIFVIGAAVIYPVYWLTTIHYPPERQVADTVAMLQSFPAPQTPEGQMCHPLRCLVDLTIWGADKPLIRPYSQYMLGLLMVTQRSVGGNMIYFLGEVANTGGPLYFPLVYLMKESLPILILILIAALFGLYGIVRAIFARRPKFKEYLITNLHEFSAIVFVSIYTLYSITSSLNIGFRHLMPILPLIYILTIGVLKKYVHTNYYKQQLKLAFIAFMFIWFVLGSLTAYPHYLSYFNETTGTDNGWRYVVDSNYDWGQDLKRLVNFVDEHNIDRIAVNYFGGGSPKYYLGEKAEEWYSSKGSPLESDIKWAAISINQIQNSIGKLTPGFNRTAADEYPWLKHPTSPDFVVGKSIFVFQLDRPA
ncbi:MAG: glycosyltransferase family 39 protein [Candidatus Colwellbacteria bacterium]|nr:glycosyltransferase family 39 protein [Candidatus Colwellbacteria bacterium]